MVFIGITLALAVNNWNAERKIKKSVKEAMAGIRAELEKNAAEIKTTEEENTYTLEGLALLLELIPNQDAK